MPVLKFGYRTERAGWPELVQIIGNKETELERISRSEEDQREYEIFRHHLKRQYKSGTDYILITKFKFSKIQILKFVSNFYSQIFFLYFEFLNKI